MRVQGHIKIKTVDTSTGRGDTSQSILEQIFNFSAPLEEILKLRREGLIKVVLPPVKPYFSSSYVERILSRLRGRCIRRDRLDKWADELGVNRTNFRRFVVQYIAMGFATVRGFLICFSSSAPALPVIVNNTEPSRAVGVRPGTVLSDDVIAVYYYLYRNNIRVLLAGRVPVEPHIWVATTLYASWYAPAIPWDEKHKESPTESQVDVLTTVWVDSYEKLEELHYKTSWVDQFIKIIRAARERTEFLILTTTVASRSGTVWKFESEGYGVLPLDREKYIEVLDEPLYYDQAVIKLYVGGAAHRYIVYLRKKIRADQVVQKVSIRKVREVK